MKEGMIQYSIIGYVSLPHEYRHKVPDPDEVPRPMFAVEVTEVRYRKWVTVDLWIVVLNFEWTSDWEPYKPSPTGMR